MRGFGLEIVDCAGDGERVVGDEVGAQGRGGVRWWEGGDAIFEVVVQLGCAVGFA